MKGFEEEIIQEKIQQVQEKHDYIVNVNRYATKGNKNITSIDFNKFIKFDNSFSWEDVFESKDQYLITSDGQYVYLVLENTIKVLDVEKNTTTDFNTLNYAPFEDPC